MTAEPRDDGELLRRTDAMRANADRVRAYPSYSVRQLADDARWLMGEYAERLGRLAAADRENAELRGEVERLRALPVWTGQWVQESIADRWKAERDEARALIARQLGDCIGCSPETGPEETCPHDGRAYTEWVEIASMVIGRQHANEAERDDLRAQLAAAQAQLAEARKEAADLRDIIEEAHKVCDRLGVPVRPVRPLTSRIEAAAEAHPEPPASDEPTGRSD